MATLFTVVLSVRRLFPGRHRVRRVTPYRASGRPLVRPVPGPARHDGDPVRQVDRLTCGPAVLVAIRCAADRTYADRLLQQPGFALRYGSQQLRAHREASRWWPRRLGTTPWGMRRWLRVHGAGRYRVRLVNAADPAELRSTVEQVGIAAAAGWPVPVLIGSTLPRHWVLVLDADAGRLLVFEPTRGVVRAVGPDAATGRTLQHTLGYPDVAAVLLPAEPRSNRGAPRRGRSVRRLGE